MDLEFRLTLALMTERVPSDDEVQDALASYASWRELARKLGATTATLRVDALGDDTTTTPTKETRP